MAKLISGKMVSAQVKARVADETAELKKKGITPGLAVVIVGDDPASRVYVNNKKKACAEVGFYSEEHALPAQTTMEELLALVRRLNADDKINGILVQLPLPKHLDEKAVIEAIDPSKDVDAFHPANVGRIMIGDYHFLPCTPAGIMEMLKSENIEIGGKECVVIGRSNIVGKPMGMLLLHRNGTVTICHSPHEKPGRSVPPGRYSGCRGGKSGICDGRHGEAGRGGDRRGNEPQRGRKALRRRRFCRC